MIVYTLHSHACMFENPLSCHYFFKMTSELTTQDLEMLLSMEIKLRLLDTEGINIPEQPPPIPK